MTKSTKVEMLRAALMSFIAAFVFAFVFFSVLGIVATFVITPLFVFDRYGVLDVDPAMVFSLKGLMLITVSALGLSLPISIWTQWELYCESKVKDRAS